MNMKTILSVTLASASMFASCGRKNDDKNEAAISGNFQPDADKSLLTEWTVDGNKNDILVIDNKGKLVRTVTVMNDKNQEIKTSVESFAIIGKKDFKILRSVSSSKNLMLKGKTTALTANFQKTNGEYQVINKNLVKIFFDAKKVSGFTLNRKTPLVDLVVAPVPPQPTEAALKAAAEAKRIAAYEADQTNKKTLMKKMFADGRAHQARIDEALEAAVHAERIVAIKNAFSKARAEQAAKDEEARLKSIHDAKMIEMKRLMKEAREKQRKAEHEAIMAEQNRLEALKVAQEAEVKKLKAEFESKIAEIKNALIESKDKFLERFDRRNND